jgi:hypothetical protein
MNRSARNVICLLFFVIPLLSAADDQQKAHKLLTKLTAMAIDPAGKRAVSQAMSQQLSVARDELARRRHALNLSYGDLFVAYELTRSGVLMDDLADRIKTGKTVWQAANDMRADWKRIASEARKLSGKVDNNLLAHFAGKKSDGERERADGYDPFRDTVKADNNVTKQEIEDAQQSYAFLRDHAGSVSGSNLDAVAEQAVRSARPDPTRTETRVGADNSGNSPPH